MKRTLVRLSVYIVAGAFLGAAGWLTLFSIVTAARPQIAIIASFSAMGLIVAIFWLRHISIVADEGIRINPPWSVAAMDCVCIIATTLASLFMIDGYGLMFSTPPLVMSDPVALSVVAVMYLPSALFLAIFVTSCSSQIVAIDAAGVVVSGAYGEEKAGWRDIQGLSPHEQYVVVSRVGIPIPRHLRTNLEIMIANGDVLTVYQPGLKSTSKLILQRLKKYAPHRLQSDLDDVGTVWL